MRNRNMSYTYRIILSKNHGTEPKMSTHKTIKKWLYTESKQRDKT